MTNPYEAFSVSDDEEDTKANVVKGEPKHKRSNPPYIQLTRKNASSKNNKKNKTKKQQSSPKPQEANPSLKRPKSLISTLTWKNPSMSGNINTILEKVITMTDVQAQAESTLLLI